MSARTFDPSQLPSGSRRERRLPRAAAIIALSISLVGAYLAGCDDEGTSSEEDFVLVDGQDGGGDVVPDGTDTSTPDDTSTPGDTNTPSDTAGDAGDGGDVPPDMADTSVPDGTDVTPDTNVPDMVDGTDAVDGVDMADMIVTPTTEINCVNGVSDDDDADVDCDDMDCDGTPPCTAEICDNMMDDDGDGDVDCDDLECASATACLSEICNNGKDDDGNGDADCDDAACDMALNCQMNPREICDDGMDNDGDYLVDCRDDQCAGRPTCSMGSATDCAAEGEACSTPPIEQNGFACIDENQDGNGVCWPLCDPFDQSTCSFGSACFDPDPQDQDPRGLCFVSECSTPFQQAECAMGETCLPFDNGYLFCSPDGMAAEGEACGDMTACESGLACVAGQCVAPCDLANPMCDGADEACVGIFSDVGYGVCDSECDAFSSGQCDAGETCVPTGADAWVCRPSAGGALNDDCTASADCGDGLICVFGLCRVGCASYAECTGSDSCAFFDDSEQFGVCGESCPGLLPDDCSSTDERCTQVTQDDNICLPHEGGQLGDQCSGFFDCGQTLFCGQDGTCGQLCTPFDAQMDYCPSDEACFPLEDDLGACAPSTTTGTAPGDACMPAFNMCDDAVICVDFGGGSASCLGFCRLSQNAADDTNTDCAATEICIEDPNGQLPEPIGLCVPGGGTP